MKPLPSPDQKLSDLTAFLRRYETAVLAFSGGVDSSFLLKVMQMTGMRILAVTAFSETMPVRDLDDATSLATALGVDHMVINTGELQNEAFVRNTPRRCFHCKDELFGKLIVLAAEKKFSSVFDGSNYDDLSDYRPGREAAAKHGVISPLALCRLAKEEIRHLSRQLGLPTWEKPSSPCLSSRFPYGTRITPEALERVGRAEEAIRALGFRVLRVRDHGETARIEVAEGEMQLLLSEENRRRVCRDLRALGYKFVTIDLEGYATGSLNRLLPDGGR